MLFFYRSLLFQVDFLGYEPLNYTAPSVLAGPYWADVDLMTM